MSNPTVRDVNFIGAAAAVVFVSAAETTLAAAKSNPTATATDW
jgi:hypothetical protein